MHADPILGVALDEGDAPAHVVVENLRAAAGNRIQPRRAQTDDGLAQRKVRVPGDGQNLRSRQTMQPDLREALFNSAEEALEPVDFEVGMNAALHQHASAAHLQRLSDLVADDLEVEDVALVRPRSAERPVEGAEGAGLGAEDGVVEIAIDY